MTPVPSKEKRILFVEDDQYIRDSISELLNLEGYKVELAENGQIALDLLRVTPELPDLILLDLMMPVMDGHTFMVERGKDPRLASLPVFIMSADASIQSKTAKTSAKDYVKKPIDIDDFLGKLARHLH